MKFDDEDESQKKKDYKSRIQGFSLTAMAYSLATGALGLYTIERFAEGKYVAGIAGAAFSTSCSIISYLAYKLTAIDAGEVSAINNLYSELIERQNQGALGEKSAEPVDNGKTFKDFSEIADLIKPTANNLEQICNPDEGAKVLPFRRALRLVTNDND